MFPGPVQEAHKLSQGRQNMETYRRSDKDTGMFPDIMALVPVLHCNDGYVPWGQPEVEQATYTCALHVHFMGYS